MSEQTIRCRSCGRTFFEVDVIARGWPRPKWFTTVCDACTEDEPVQPVRYRRKFDPISDKTKRRLELAEMSPEEKEHEALYVIAAEVSAACDAWCRRRGLAVGNWRGDGFDCRNNLDET